MKVTTLLFCFVLYLLSFQSIAQLSVQGGILSPTGNWSEYWKSGLGGHLTYLRNIGKQTRVGGSIGYFSLPGREFKVNGGILFTNNSEVVPVLISFDYEPFRNIFVGADAGYNVISIDTSGPAIGSGSAYSSENSLGIIPKISANIGRIKPEIRYSLLGSTYLSILIGIVFNPPN